MIITISIIYIIIIIISSIIGTIYGTVYNAMYTYLPIDSYFATEGYRGGSGGIVSSCNTKPLEKKIDALDSKITNTLNRYEGRLNTMTEFSFKNFCSMVNTETPESSRDHENLKFCRQKAKDYKWNREYWLY